MTNKKDAIYWSAYPEAVPKPELLNDKNFKWVRAYDVYANSPFFGKNDPDHADVLQGYWGNCWFMSAAGALAERHPDLIKDIFHNVKNNRLNKQGLYEFNFWNLGVPASMFADDFMPLKELEDSYETVFARVRSEMVEVKEDKKGKKM